MQESLDTATVDTDKLIRTTVRSWCSRTCWSRSHQAQAVIPRADSASQESRTWFDAGRLWKTRRCNLKQNCYMYMYNVSVCTVVNLTPCSHPRAQNLNITSTCTHCTTNHGLHHTHIIQSRRRRLRHTSCRHRCPSTSRPRRLLQVFRPDTRTKHAFARSRYQRWKPLLS